MWHSLTHVVYDIHHLWSYHIYLKCCLLSIFIQEIYSFYCQYILTAVQIRQMSFGTFLFNLFIFAETWKPLGYLDVRSQISLLYLKSESSAIGAGLLEFSCSHKLRTRLNMFRSKLFELWELEKSPRVSGKKHVARCIAWQLCHS